MNGVAVLGDDHVLVGAYAKDVVFGKNVGPLVKANPTIDGGAPDQDAFVVRRRSDGSVVWQVSLGGTGTDRFNAVTADGGGNVYASGHFESPTIQGTVPFPGAASSATNAGDGGFVMKFDGTDGKLLWVDRFSRDVSKETCSLLDVDGGNLVATCLMGQGPQKYFLPYDVSSPQEVPAVTNQKSGVAVYGLDPATGRLRWVHAIGGVGSAVVRADSLKISDDRVVVAGVHYADRLQDTNSAINLDRRGNCQNGFFVEFDVSNGTPTWSRSFGNPNGSCGVGRVGAVGTSDTGLFVGAAFTKGIDLGAGELRTEQDGGDSLLARFERGDDSAPYPPPVWQKRLGGDDGFATYRALERDACGRLVYVLRARTTPITDGGVPFPTPKPDQTATFIAKFAPNGTLLSAHGPTPAGDPTDVELLFGGLAIDAEDRTVLAGSFRGAVDFGGGTPEQGIAELAPYVLVHSP